MTNSQPSRVFSKASWKSTLRAALDALNLANELGLGLRVTRSLGYLAVAMSQLGYSSLSQTYLERAIALAREQGFWLFDRHLQQLRVDGGLVAAPRIVDGQLDAKRPTDRPASNAPGRNEAP